VISDNRKTSTTIVQTKVFQQHSMQEQPLQVDITASGAFPFSFYCMDSGIIYRISYLALEKKCRATKIETASELSKFLWHLCGLDVLYEDP
jgi:hypothetical protein